MDFAETLRQLREAAGLTQAGLAEKAGLSLRTVQSWEQGRRSPVSPDFFRLTSALGISCDVFAKNAMLNLLEPVKDTKPAPKKPAAVKRKGK